MKISTRVNQKVKLVIMYKAGTFPDPDSAMLRDIFTLLR